MPTETCIFFRLRTGIRWTQNGKTMPFFFIISGFADSVSPGLNTITFLLWIFLGLNVFTLFVLEELLLIKHQKQIAFVT